MKIDASTSQQEIDETIDDPQYLSIVNSSGWPASRCITMQSKNSFLISKFSKRVNLMKFLPEG